MTQLTIFQMITIYKKPQRTKEDQEKVSPNIMSKNTPLSNYHLLSDIEKIELKMKIDPERVLKIKALGFVVAVEEGKTSFLALAEIK